MPHTLPQLIDGQLLQSQATDLIEVTDPATQEVIALAPKATAEEIEAAVAGAQKAFLAWREVPVSERARLMLRYQHLLKEHHDELAEILARIPARLLPTPRATSGVASKWPNTPPTSPA